MSQSSMAPISGQASQPAPGAPDPSQSGQDMSQGYTIEIAVDAQGAITVDVEPAAQEQAEDQSGGGQSVPDIKTALQTALDIYKNSGQIDNSGAQAQAGFDSAQDQPQPGAQQ